MAPWSTQCLDWEQRIVDRLSLIPFDPLFPDNAVEALDVFDALIMVDAPNQPTMGEVSLPWIRDFVAQIFGSYQSDIGKRHILEYFLLISKKNGKSTDAAAIMLTALILNWRHGAEFLILSPTIEVAKNSFEPAAAMVRADPELSKLLSVQDHVRTITHRTTGAKLKVVAADSNTVSGKKATGILIDELWAFGKMANAENMIREATGGLTSRPEGFIIYLTTQSDEPPAGVFKARLEYARGVRDGTIKDNRFLPLIYEFPKRYLEDLARCVDCHTVEDALVLQPANFYITNPNLGLSVDPEYIERKISQALMGAEGTLNGEMAKHLNVEVGMNLRADRWPGALHWTKGAKPERVQSLAHLLSQCEVATIGIDGGGLDDLLGLAVVGRTKDEEDIVHDAYKDDLGVWVPAGVRRAKRWLVWTYAWAHPTVLSQRKDIVSKLRDFEKNKEMSLVSSVGADIDELVAIVMQVEDSGLLWRVGLDPALIGSILDALDAGGLPVDPESKEECKAVTVNQGWRLAGSIKNTERKLASGILIHDGSGLMVWCVGNAKVKVVGNAIVITKQVSGTAKIDPLMALFNAVSLMALNPPAQVDQNDMELMVIAG